MSCIILITKETVYQTTEWIPVQMELASQENESKGGETIASPDEIPISPDERINPKTNIREKKHHDERINTTFEYNIPNNVRNQKLITELNGLYSIVNMISVFTDMGYTLKHVTSSTVHTTSMYTKYILCKNSTPSPNQNSTQIRQPRQPFKPDYKKKNYPQ